MPTDKRIILDNRSQLFETALDESLVLLSLLDPAEPSQATHTSKPPHERKTAFHRQFLDHLSWLCDPFPKGKTVAAIGVQDSPDGYKFWIASNNGCRGSVKRHLQWLLRAFQELIEGRTTIDAARNEIFRRSVEISSERVENYVARLAKVVAHCSRLQRTCETDRALLRAVAHILEAREKHRLVCMRAFDFRGTDNSRTLQSKAMSTGPTGCWQLLRHYIGRLGSWSKAALVVTATTDKLGHILYNATVHTIPLVNIDKNRLNRTTKSLDEVFRRIMSTSSSDQLEAAKDGLQRRYGSAADEHFAGRLQRRRKTLCPHAEAAVLAHFHRRKFRFAASLAYVGCSKPSCFCCRLYADIHPLRTIPRKSHGNTWVKWVLPCPTRVKLGQYCCTCACIVRHMLQHIEREIRRRLLLPVLPVYVPPESTTNMSSVAMSKAGTDAPEEDSNGALIL